MADELSNFLLQGDRHAKISPETLELMGKQAANMFLNEGIALNTGIAKLAGAHADISHEQVKRVVEFANQSVYLAKHDKNKTAGANSSYPQFELADAGRIIQDLSDGARPTTITPTDIEYAKHPNRIEKVASSKADALISEMFGHEERVKTASLDYSPQTTETEVMGAKHMLVGLKENLEHAGERFDLMHKEAQVEYYAIVKQHLLNEGSFTDVLDAAARSASKEKVAEILEPVITKLLQEKVATVRALSDAAKQLEKVAHRSIDEEHPLVTGFRTIYSLDAEMTKVATGLGQVDAELTKVNSFIREQIRASVSAR